MGAKRKWNPRRKRRHLVRRNDPSRTLCGRRSEKVVLVRKDGPYPKDRCNCSKCKDVMYANLRRNFNAKYEKMCAGQLTSVPSDEEFLESGQDHYPRRRKPKGRPIRKKPTLHIIR